jgi:hypothetical protein
MMRATHRTALALLVFGLIPAVVFLVAQARAEHPASGGEPCPTRPRHVQPVGFHFSPGLYEHQSWIEFAVPEPDATAFTLCLDGRLWETGIGHTPENGRVEVSVKTSFIDIEWLLGRLDEFSRPERWQLGYTTYSLGQR